MTERIRRPVGRPRVIDLDEAVRLRGDGWSFNRIGQKFGVSRQSVLDLMKRHGLHTTHPHTRSTP